MSGLLKSIAIGRLSKTCELKTSKSNTSYTILDICVVERKGDPPKWINGVLIGERAKKLCPYLTKGTFVCIDGKSNPEAWIGKDGKANARTSIMISELVFTGGGDYGAKSDKGANNDNNVSLEKDDIPF